jgi:hypothetical protein
MISLEDLQGLFDAYEQSVRTNYVSVQVFSLLF